MDKQILRKYSDAVRKIFGSNNWMKMNEWNARIIKSNVNANCYAAARNVSGGNMCWMEEESAC